MPSWSEHFNELLKNCELGANGCIVGKDSENQCRFRMFSITFD